MGVSRLRRARASAVPADGLMRMPAMRVAIVDVGANTARLLVATLDATGRVEPLREEKRQLDLGEEIERNGGEISAEKLDEVVAVAHAYVRRGRKLGASQLRILVTSPGRQASNGDELVDALRSTGAPADVLTAEEEGALAWRGAVGACREPLPESIGVCDVGGGSVQLVVGTPAEGPAWIRSVDVGSLRLTRRAFHDDPPKKEQVAFASEEVARLFADVLPPLPRAALATGGSARALRRVAQGDLDEPALKETADRLAKRSSRQISKEFGVDRARARTLTAGTILLAEAQRRLGVPLVPARGGIREGAAIEALAGRASATG